MLSSTNCDSNKWVISLETLSTTNFQKVMVGLILDDIQKKKIQLNHNPIVFPPENMVLKRKLYNHLLGFTMKQKKTSTFFDSLRHKFPPIPLYRSDLEEILRVAEARGLRIVISDDKYEYETLDDLKENRGSRVKKLTVTLAPEESAYQSITVEIDSDGVLLRSSKDDKLVPVWHEIKDAIEKQAPWYARFMKPLSWAYGAMLFLWLSPKRDQIREGLEWIENVWLGFGSLMFLLSLLSVIYLNRSRGVYLQREHEVQGFWDRYGEKLVFLILGTVLGVAGKVISDKLSGS